MDGEPVFTANGHAIRSIAFDQPRNSLYVTAKFSREFHVQLIGDQWMSVKSKEMEIPIEAGLSEIYPNPFNSEVIIKYETNITGNVEVSVFDITGRKVFESFQPIVQPGRHSYELSAESWDSGIYLIRLKSGERTFTKKLICIK